MNPQQRTGEYRFGDFRFSEGTQLLEHNGESVALTPKARQLLQMLLARAPNVVTREELRHALWSDSTYIEFEGALNACVRQARAALGDTAANSAFIETLPKQGYRFVAGIRGRSGWRRPLNMLAIATLIALLAVAVTVSKPFLGSKTADPPQTLAVLPVEADAGVSMDPVARYGIAVIASDLIDGRAAKRYSVINTRSVRELASMQHGLLLERKPDLIVHTRIEKQDGHLYLQGALIRGSDGERLANFSHDLGTGMPAAIRDSSELIAEWLADALDLEEPDEPDGQSRNTDRSLDDNIVRAMWLLESGARDDADSALRLLNDVLEGQPDHVWALESKILALMELAYHHQGQSRAREYLDEIETLSEFVNASGAHSNRGYLGLSIVRLLRDWRVLEATNHIEAALLISPGDARAHSIHAFVRAAGGDTAGAVRSAEMAERLDPAAMVVRSDRCWLLLADLQFQEAATACANILAILPDDNAALFALARALKGMGQEQQGLQVLLDAVRRRDEDVFDGFQAMPSTWQEFGCQRAGALVRDGVRHPVSNLQLARYQVYCGREEQALEHLRRAIEEREFGVLLLRSDESFAPLRVNEDFQALLDALP